MSEELRRPRRLLTSQFVTQSYRCRATNLVASEKMIIYGKWRTGFIWQVREKSASVTGYIGAH